MDNVPPFRSGSLEDAAGIHSNCGPQIEIFRIARPEIFDQFPEAAMDAHFGVFAGRVYVIVGCRVAIPTGEPWDEPAALDLAWRRTGLTAEDRNAAFEEWLHSLPEATDNVAPVSPSALGVEVGVWRSRRVDEREDVMALIVGPLAPLPGPPPRPASLYGHLPFGAKTDPDMLIYRWEAFPKSRRIVRTAAGGQIARDTYAAPASEVPFAPTGFAALARFALPNLMPAMYRWELQPVAGTFIECGASVPLYGQSGGGVEVRFPRLTQNRCPIADPAQLPAL